MRQIVDFLWRLGLESSIHPQHRIVDRKLCLIVLLLIARLELVFILPFYEPQMPNKLPCIYRFNECCSAQNSNGQQDTNTIHYPCLPIACWLWRCCSCCWSLRTHDRGAGIAWRATVTQNRLNLKWEEKNNPRLWSIPINQWQRRAQHAIRVFKHTAQHSNNNGLFFRRRPSPRKLFSCFVFWSDSKRLSVPYFISIVLLICININRVTIPRLRPIFHKCLLLYSAGSAMRYDRTGHDLCPPIWQSAGYYVHVPHVCLLLF